MKTESFKINAKLVNWFETFSIFGAALVVIFGLLTGAGWVFDVDFLKRPLPDDGLVYGSMSIAFVLSGIGILCVGAQDKRVWLIGRSLGIVVALAGAMTFTEDIACLDLGLNCTIYQPQPDSRGLTFPGPMGPNVAFAFLLLGLSIASFNWKLREKYIFQYLAVASGALSAMALIGHSCGASYLCTLVGCIKMPLSASFALLFLSTSVLFAIPRLGIVEIFVKDGLGGRIARRAACFAAIVPVLLWLNKSGQDAQLYDAAFGWTVFAVVTIILAVICIAGSAEKIHAVEAAHSEAQQELERVTKSLPASRRTTFRNICLSCDKEFPHETESCPDCGSELDRVAQDVLVGSIFAEKYEMLELLGCGGMSSVYKAKHTVIGRVYAIKLMLAQASSNLRALKRFHIEAKAASQLSHPNLIAIHDFGFSSQGDPYLVMDFADGVSLGRIIYEEDRLTPDRVIKLFIPICEGLAEAHKHNVIHRDLKPENIMIVSDAEGGEKPVIVDFGLAKEQAEDTSDKLTKTGEVFGTPFYMSPEQCLGEKADTRADIYALGCIMYECLTGHPPFESEVPFAIMKMHVTQAPAPFAPDLGVPQWLEELVMACLRKERESRPASMQEIRDGLVLANSGAPV